jgi:hypothetical protein
MIVVILKPVVRKRASLDVELRMLIEGMTEAEADALGEAIHEFAVKMKRRETMSAFQLDELVSN